MYYVTVLDECSDQLCMPVRSDFRDSETVGAPGYCNMGLNKDSSLRHISERFTLVLLHRNQSTFMSSVVIQYLAEIQQDMTVQKSTIEAKTDTH